MSLVDKLTSRGLITPPKHLKTNVCFEVQMGSVAYGCSSDASDIDVYGFSIPNKNMIFPHLDGHIQGFGRQVKSFGQYQQHHIKDKESDKEYDISIYNIVKYFQLVMDNNPNMIDSLFVPRRCVLHSTAVGEYVREKRHLFLSKKAFHTFKGYAYSQLNKCKNKNIHKFVEFCNSHKLDVHITAEEFEKDVDAGEFTSTEENLFYSLYNKVYQNGVASKRISLINKYGYDIKFAYHIIRLLNECEQILTEHDMDLERNREQLKSIRRGDWTLEDVEIYFAQKELSLEKVYNESVLRWKADEDEIKQVLIDCLEIHFGSLEKAIIIPSDYKKDLSKANELIENVLRRM